MKLHRTLMLWLLVIVGSVQAIGQELAGGQACAARPVLWSAEHLVDIHVSARARLRAASDRGVADLGAQRAQRVAQFLLCAMAQTAAGQDELVSVLRNSRNEKSVQTAAYTLGVGASSFRLIPALLEIAENPALPIKNRQEALQAVRFLLIHGFGSQVPVDIERVAELKTWLRENHIEFSDEGYAHHWIRRIAEYDNTYEKARDFDSAGGVAYSLVALDGSRESQIVLPFLIARLKQPPRVDVEDPYSKGRDKLLVWMALKHVRPSEIQRVADEPLSKALVRWWDSAGAQALAPDGLPTLEDLLLQGNTITNYREYVAWANRVRLRSGKSIDLPVVAELGMNSQTVDGDANTELRYPPPEIAQLIRATGVLQAQYRLLLWMGDQPGTKPN